MCLVHVDKELFIAIIGLLRSQVFQNIWRKMEGYEMMQDESPQWSKSKIKTIVDEILHSDYWTIFFLYAWQFYFLKNHIIIHSKNSNFYSFIGFYEKKCIFYKWVGNSTILQKTKNIWFHSVSFFCQGLTFLTFFALKNCSLEMDFLFLTLKKEAQSSTYFG